MSRLARLLLVVGTAVAVVGLSKFHAAEVAEPPYDYTASSRLAWSMGYAGLLLLCAYSMGVPELNQGRRRIMLAAVASAGLAALGVSVLQLGLGTALLPRFVVFGVGLVLVPWFWICANLAVDGKSWEAQRDRVIVVGSWAEAAELTRELEESSERPAVVVDVLEPAQVRPSRRLDRPLLDAVAAGDATVVVLDRDAQADPTVVGQVAELHEQGTRVRTLSLFYEEWLGKLPMAELERVSLLFDIGELHRRRYARQRRVVDLLLGVLGLVGLVLVLPLVAVGNLVGNRGSLFFRQERVGRHGRPFTMLKFRTMRDGADTSSWTQEEDPRITPFGNVLRRSHLDELPQVLNVLRGQLAVVGPRPEQPKYVAELSEKLPFYRLRHLVKPGLTGWAQVKQGYAADESDALEKLQYEFYYLRHQGLALDLRIVARTVRSVVRWAGT